MNVKTFKKTYKKSASRRKATPESESNQQEIVIKYLRLAYPDAFVASPEQKRWQEQLRNRGYCSYICKGSEEAMKIIDEYFNE